MKFKCLDRCGETFYLWQAYASYGECKRSPPPHNHPPPPLPTPMPPNTLTQPNPAPPFTFHPSIKDKHRGKSRDQSNKNLFRSSDVFCLDIKVSLYFTVANDCQSFNFRPLFYTSPMVRGAALKLAAKPTQKSVGGCSK